MYVRFPLSLRNVEDLLHERGIDICHETVRYWWNKFGPLFAGEIRKKRMHGYLTQSQFTELCKVQEHPTISGQVREALDSVFESARTDPLTEIPLLTDSKKDISNA